MPSVQDWATKAAKRIQMEKSPSTDRIAAIIATYAEPLLEIVRGAKRDHYVSHNPFNDCEKADDDDDTGTCTCGADEWNAKVDKVLQGDSDA